MASFSAFTDRVIDAHVHLHSTDLIDPYAQLCVDLGFEQMNILGIFDRDSVHDNHAAYVAKARYPSRFGVFPALDHTALWSDGKIDAPSLAEQVDRLASLGADGIKMLESLPYKYAEILQPLDGRYYADFFARAAETGTTLLWHVANPQTFWDKATIPQWADKLGWYHDETVLTGDALRAQAEAVLARRPELKVIFAHFYFHGGLLARTAELFETYPNVTFDLALGIELTQQLSEDAPAAREFFIRYADRIIFGTDIMSWQTPAEAVVRAHTIRRWLETDEMFDVPADADPYLGSGEGGPLVGLALPADVLAKIYAGNFERLTGPSPRPLDIEAAEAECRRVARIVATATDTPVAETAQARAADQLSALQ